MNLEMPLLFSRVAHVDAAIVQLHPADGRQGAQRRHEVGVAAMIQRVGDALPAVLFHQAIDADRDLGRDRGVTDLHSRVEALRERVVGCSRGNGGNGQPAGDGTCEC